MADIKKELNDIKNAVYGREVRSSIHDGIKKINEESEESKQKAEEAHEITQDLLDETFDSAALEANFEQRLNDEIENLQPEWTGFKNDVTAQLAQTATNLDLANAKQPLQIKTYLGDNQATHPKVIYFKDEWNGYKFWMAYTAYPNGQSQYENPCIACSNDGINWTIPNGLTNPIADRPEGAGAFNSDTHIFMVGDTMHLWYREVVGEVVTIWEHTSTDGANWSERRAVQVMDGSIRDWVSPAVIYEDGKYKVWFGDVGRKIKYMESTDGENWANERELNIDFASLGLIPWHYDVEKTDLGYEFLIAAHRQGESYNDTDLYYVFSSDNINFSKPIKVIEKSKHPNTFDNQAIYRSCMVKVNGVYLVYYSGWQKELEGRRYRALGLSIGESIDKLRGLEFTPYWDLDLNGRVNMPNGAYLQNNSIQLADGNGNQANMRINNTTIDFRETIFSPNFKTINVDGVQFHPNGGSVRGNQLNLRTGDLKLCLRIESDGSASLRDTYNGSYINLKIGELHAEKIWNLSELKLRNPGISASRIIPSEEIVHTARVRKDSNEEGGGLEVKYLYFDTGSGTMPDIEGAIRYNKDTKKHQGFDGTTWHDLY